MNTSTKQKIMWVVAIAALGFAFMRLPGCGNPGEGKHTVGSESVVRRQPGHSMPSAAGQKPQAAPRGIKEQVRSRSEAK